MQNLSEKLLENPEVIADYRAGKTTAADLAKTFGYSETYVLTTLSRIGARRDPKENSTYAQQKQSKVMAGLRREFRMLLAKRILDRALTLKDAAEAAECSERTLRRYVKVLENAPKTRKNG